MAIKMVCGLRILRIFFAGYQNLVQPLAMMPKIFIIFSPQFFFRFFNIFHLFRFSTMETNFLTSFQSEVIEVARGRQNRHFSGHKELTMRTGGSNLLKES